MMNRVRQLTLVWPKKRTFLKMTFSPMHIPLPHVHGAVHRGPPVQIPNPNSPPIAPSGPPATT